MPSYRVPEVLRGGWVEVGAPSSCVGHPKGGLAPAQAAAAACRQPPRQLTTCAWPTSLRAPGFRVARPTLATAARVAHTTVSGDVIVSREAHHCVVGDAPLRRGWPQKEREGWGEGVARRGVRGSCRARGPREEGGSSTEWGGSKKAANLGHERASAWLAKLAPRGKGGVRESQARQMVGCRRRWPTGPHETLAGRAGAPSVSDHAAHAEERPRRG